MERVFKNSPTVCVRDVETDRTSSEGKELIVIYVFR